MTDRALVLRQSPLVGRDDEVERLQSALDAVTGGDGRSVLISGEPGIGKTRLVEEVAALAADQAATVAWGRVDDAEGAPPYWPWIQILDDVLDGADPQVIGDALGGNAGPIAAIFPRVKEYVAEITPPPLLDPASARFRLHQAIVDFLRRVSAQQPLMVVLDDMHWADVASLELTKFATPRLNSAAVLLVFAYRTVDGGASEVFDDLLASLARQPTLERIALAGLDEAEVGRFMAQTIGVRSRRAVVATVHTRTEGNPFFVSELARLLHSEGRLGTTNPAADSSVPAGVRDVVRRRLLRLPNPTIDLLALGAVIGREFDLAVLAATAELDGCDIVDAIEPAVSAGVINEAAGGAGRFRFSHALIRDSVYAQLSELRRASLHARVGAAFEEREGTDGTHLAELAWHFSRAVPIVGPERALTYTLQAAQTAQGAIAFEQAEDHLRQALTLINLLPASRNRLEREIQVQNGLAELLTTTRGFSASETADAWTRSRQLHTELGDARDLLVPLYGLSVAHCTRGDHMTAAAVGRQLLDLGDAVNDPALILAGHDVIGMTSLERGHLADARRHLEEAMRLADSIGSSSLLQIFPMHAASVTVELAIVYYLMGDDDLCRVLRADAKRVRDDLTHPLSVGPGLIIDLQVQVCQGTTGTLPEDAAEASKRCQDWGLMELAATADFWGASALQQRDGRDRTSELVEALKTLEKSGFRMWRSQHLAVLAGAYWQIGDINQALRIIDEGLAEAEYNDERFWEPELLRLRGELLLACDPKQVQAASQSVGQAITLARTQGSSRLLRRAQETLASFGATTPEPALQPGAGDGSPLSRRERELLSLVGRGLTDKQIAGELTISLATVRSHLDRIRDKTGRRRRPELTLLAVDLGLVSS